jgi:tetratricopeptide (TPR) repeat protein
VGRYHPAYLTVPLEVRGFPGLVKTFPEYVPVFFDDTEVLYVSRSRFPDVAKQHAITEFNPFEVVPEDVDVLLAREDAPALLMLAHRLLRVDPTSGFANSLVASALLREHDPRGALPHAMEAVRQYPDSFRGYWRLAESWSGLGRHDRAIAAAWAAARMAVGEDQRVMWKVLGRIYRRAGMPAQAYDAMRQGIDLFGERESPEELFELGSVAREAKRTQEARAIFEFLQRHRLGSAEETLKTRVDAALGSLPR